ncbi:drug resistance transporter, Bcr/CflA subfamily [Gemella bergeri ATCC 700627]|uniref:Bcr/CflA family efflux transporter n=1 Tax=Gemella bergeri ATCC 700627 TaxID=1321820 RepID=U2Q753_9BACL|nr:multidrug effflux MFS transporter [Gemella bergeri]ERK58595.1 drug resistance transporter, Bcr/CflA subfamily [Gemella bergeri ATCC 700627]
MTQKKNSKLFLVLFLGTLSAFGPFVTDLYLPALPFMAEYFGANTSTIQLTLTGSMVGLALGQLLIGPISDKFGRKQPLIISLIIYLISTIAIIVFPNIYAMIILRFVQGISSAGAVVISRAISTDLYRGREMAEFFALLMAVNGLAPIISPVVGSLLLQLTDWRGIFITLAIIGIIIIIAAFKLVESLKEEKRLNVPILKTYNSIVLVSKNKLFTILVLIQAFALATMFAYIAASPFILQTHYKLSPFLYSLCFGLNGFALVVGSKAAGRFNEKKSIKLGLSIMLILSIYLAIILTLALPFLFVEVGFFFLLLGLGFILPSGSALAMNLERERAGSASALFGFLPFFLGGVVSPLVGLGNIFHSSAIAIVFCSAVSYLLFKTIERKI